MQLFKWFCLIYKLSDSVAYWCCQTLIKTVSRVVGFPPAERGVGEWPQPLGRVELLDAECSQGKKITNLCITDKLFIHFPKRRAVPQMNHPCSSNSAIED